MAEQATQTEQNDVSSFKALSLSEAKTLILERHRINVSENDPVMMLVTLHEAFLKDQECALERHNKAITVIMSSTVNDLRESLHAETQRFAESVQKLAEDSAVSLLAEHQEAMKSHRQFLFCATVALVAIPAVMFGLLFGALLWKL